jgi:toxin ParE1/3/4
VPDYRLSFAASDDILNIFLEGLERFDLAQADKYHHGLASTFGFLAEYPRAARLRDEIDPPVRVHPYKAHIIVYEIGADDTVLILRVRHGREDWQTPETEE